MDWNASWDVIHKLLMTLLQLVQSLQLNIMVIFKVENLSTQWILAHIHGNWQFNYNSKGWTSNEHGLDWLK